MRIFNKKKPITNHQSLITKFGFTLVEMLVATGVFVTLTVIALGIFSHSLRAERQTISLSKVQREAQLITESLAKKIRTSQVDYSWTYNADGVPGIQGDEEELALLDSDKTSYVFSLGSGTINVSVDGGAPLPIPSTEVKVNSLKFYIQPGTNPFSPNAPPASMPKVTMVIDFQVTKGDKTTNLLVQQTVPQRSGGF